MTTMARPTGPQGYPLIGNLPAFGHDPLNFLTQLAHEHGDIARFSYGIPAVLLSHPDDIERVLLDTGKRFHKGYQRGFAMPLVLGNGLVTSEGSFWRRQRKAMAPAFHSKRIAHYADTMVAFTEQMLASWHTGAARDVHHDMMLLTQRIVAQTLFGVNVQHDAQQFTRALDMVMHEFHTELLGVTQFLPTFVPTPGRARLEVAVARIDQLILRIINARRADPQEHHDLLAMLMEARDDDDTPMTDRQLRDEVLTLYGAGHETTANTLAWTWMLLAQHPHVRAALEAELTQVLGGRTPTMHDVRALPYTNAVLKEAMRLYPAVWNVTRVASEDVEIGGYHIAQDTEVWLSQWVVHRDARWFKHPTVFEPQRWLDGLEDRLPRYAYFPFGGGPRICIGNNFAIMEGVLLLATIAQQFRLDLASNPPVVPDPSITLRPRHGVPVRLTAR